MLLMLLKPAHASVPVVGDDFDVGLLMLFILCRQSDSLVLVVRCF